MEYLVVIEKAESNYCGISSRLAGLRGNRGNTRRDYERNQEGRGNAPSRHDEKMVWLFPRPLQGPIISINKRFNPLPGDSRTRRTPGYPGRASPELLPGTLWERRMPNARPKPDPTRGIPALYELVSIRKYPICYLPAFPRDFFGGSRGLFGAENPES